MKKTKVLIADSSYLIRKGFCSLIEEMKEFTLVAEAQKAEDLHEKLLLYNPDVLVIDYATRYFCLDDISVIHQYFPEVNILAITYPQPKSTISKALTYGVISHLLKDCGEEEIIEAIVNTSKKQKFLCGKVVDILTDGHKMLTSGKVPCGGIKLSEKEVEALRLITERPENRHIADRLLAALMR